MDNIQIKAQKENYYTPQVDFNAQTGVCEISGESYLEDAFVFYKPLKEWIEEFSNKSEKPIHFICKLTYFNTSSSKGVLSILKILKSFEEKGRSIIAQWYYRPNDLDMLEDIEDLIYESKLNIELIPLAK
jgi:hypothetical protein